jgi:hypothetical protein
MYDQAEVDSMDLFVDGVVGDAPAEPDGVVTSGHPP